MKKTLLLIAVILIGNSLLSNNKQTVIDYTQLSSTQLLSPTENPQPNHLEFRYYGFYGVVDLTYMTNLNKTHDLYTDKYSLMGLTAVAGFQWRKESAVGLGMSYLSDPTGSFSQIPIFIELRSYYTRNRLAPYSAIQMGYSIPLGTTNGGIEYTMLNQGGITLGAEIGGRLAFTRHFGINLGVGYQFIMSNSVERGDAMGAITRLPEHYHNLKAHIGFCF